MQISSYSALLRASEKSPRIIQKNGSDLLIRHSCSFHFGKQPFEQKVRVPVGILGRQLPRSAEPNKNAIVCLLIPKLREKERHDHIRGGAVLHQMDASFHDSAHAVFSSLRLASPASALNGD